MTSAALHEGVLPESGANVSAHDCNNVNTSLTTDLVTQALTPKLQNISCVLQKLTRRSVFQFNIHAWCFPHVIPVSLSK